MEKIILVVSFIFISLFILQPDKGQISGISTKSASVNMDISIGEYQFDLFGYSSANALVTIEGMGIYDQTYADRAGYFEFNNRFSPFSPREACLTARDQFGRTTSPTCIPPFPTKYNVSIGPVILPPTVSLDAQNYYQGDEIKLSGQTIPNTEVTFSTFVDEKKSFVQYLSSIIYNLSSMIYPRPVEAFTIPQLTARSDEKGNFSLLLPSSRPEFFRLFAQTSYENSRSPDSVRLNIKVLPVWMIIIQFFLFVWSLMKSRLLELLIVAELIGLTIFFLRRYLHHHVIAKNRALAIRKLYPIVEEETSIIIPERHDIRRWHE